MSIYRRSKYYSDLDVTAPVSSDAVAYIPPAPNEPTSNWAAVRKSNPVNVVLPRTRTWSDELPSHLRPTNLLDQFPRIANPIAFDWNNPTMVCKHFDDLLVDRRGNRRGFPTEVRQELRALRDYYYLDVLPGTRNGSEDAVRTQAYVLRLALVLILTVAIALPADAARSPKRIGPAFLDGQVLVGFQPGAPAAAKSDAHRQAGGQVQRSLDQIGVDLVAVPTGTVAQSIAVYQKNPIVRFAEPNYVRVMILPTEGKDPPWPFGTGIDYLKEQWSLNNTGQSFYYDPWTGELGAITGAADADIDAPEGWDLSTGSATVKIALLDAGVDCQHVDLKTKCMEQLLVTSLSPTVEDIIGHGTHVAAIAAAETDNGKGTAGVGWNSTFGSLKVCYEYDDFFLGLVGLCDTAASATAMMYAADQGYKVVNMSYAGPDSSQTEAAAAKYAWDHGVVLVAAAANAYERTPMYPAAYPEVIAVAATDWFDNLAGFSNFGSDWVSVAAPGYYVFSALPNAACGIPADDPLGCYGWLSGTSMASPHVAGTAALVWAKLGSGATPQQVRAAIESGADKTGALGQNFLAWTKHGRLNVYGALNGGTPPPPSTVVHVGDLDGLASASQGGRWTAKVTIEVHDADHGPVSGITVAGAWSSGASGGSSCVTAGGGQCQVSKQVQKNSASATFSVNSLSGATYNAGLNHDPDGDSNGSALTVSKP